MAMRSRFYFLGEAEAAFLGEAEAAFLGDCEPAFLAGDLEGDLEAVILVVAVAVGCWLEKRVFFLRDG